MRKTFLITLTAGEIIRRLKAGEVVKCERSDKVFYMVDGILVNEDSEDIVIGGCFTVDRVNDYYFEEEEQFEITETGVYRTRDGRKVFVYKIDDETDDRYPICYILGDMEHLYTTSKQGRYNIMEETKNDIVAKWED